MFNHGEENGVSKRSMLCVMGREAGGGDWCACGVCYSVSVEKR